MKEILWINAKHNEKVCVKAIERKHHEDLELLNQKKITMKDFQERSKKLLNELDELKADYDVLYEKEGIDVKD